MLVEQWKYYNMCDVALHAMSGCALATLVRAEVVMVETPVTESSILPGGRSAHRPSPVQEHRQCGWWAGCDWWRGDNGGGGSVLVVTPALVHTF